MLKKVTTEYFITSTEREKIARAYVACNAQREGGKKNTAHLSAVAAVRKQRERKWYRWLEKRKEERWYK